MKRKFFKTAAGVISVSMLLQSAAALNVYADSADTPADTGGGEAAYSDVAKKAGNYEMKMKGKAFQRGGAAQGVTVFDSSTMPDETYDGTTYYISVSGDDSNSGTSPQNAWQSPEKINSVTFGAGDRILFEAGGEWEAPESADGNLISSEDDDADERYDYWIMPKGAGENGNPVVIGAYGEGALPKLNGSSKTNSVLSIKDSQYWDISNLDISNYDESFDYGNVSDANNAKKMGDLRGIDIFGQSMAADADGNRVMRGFNLHHLYVHDVTGYVYWGGKPADRGYPGDYGNMGQDASKRTGGIVFEVWKPTTERYLGFDSEQQESFDNYENQMKTYKESEITAVSDYMAAVIMKAADEDRDSYGESEQTKYNNAANALLAYDTQNSTSYKTDIDTLFANWIELMAVRKAVQDADDQDQPITFDDVTIANNVIYDTSFGGITVKQWEGDGHKEVDVSPFFIEAVYPTNEAWGRRAGADQYWDDAAKTLTKEDPGWHPHTNIVIRDNYVSQEGMEQGCNTIRIASAAHTLVEHNVCAGSGTCAIELDYLDDNVTQFNEVYGTYKKMGGADNNAIDTDYRTTNCLVQGNFVYNNGDSFLLCGKVFSTAVYRYNIAANSEANEHYIAVDGDKGYNYIYNNLFYNNLEVSRFNYITTNGSDAPLTAANPLYVYNNIFYNACDKSTEVQIQDESKTAGIFNYDSNSYYGAGIKVPASDENAILDDPYLTDTDAIPFGDTTRAVDKINLDIFAISDKSPLINKGRAVVLPETFKGEIVDQYIDLKDMFGNSVNALPDIGVSEYQFEDNKGIIRGHVVDEYNQPLEGVTLKAVLAENAELLNEDTDIQLAAAQDYLITVTDGDLTDGKAAVSIENRSAAEEKVMVILAVYDKSGVLNYLDTQKSITLPTDHAAEVTFQKVPTPDGEHTAKIMLWNSFDNMIPLTDTVNLDEVKPTDVPTATPTATPTVTDAPTATPTATPAVTDAPTPTSTAAPAVTDAPTATPAAVPSVTDEPTATPTVTNAPTATPTATPAVTDAPTATPTAVPSVTDAPTPTPVPQPDIIETKTDENGYYSFGEIDTGSYIIQASYNGYQTVTYAAVELTEEDVLDINTITLESTATTGTVTGRVTCAGIAVEGANVSIADTDTSAVTVEDGTYTLEAPVNDNCSIIISKDGYLSQTRTGIKVQKGRTTADTDFAIVPSDTGEHTYAVADDFNEYNAGDLSSDKWTKYSGTASVIAEDENNNYLRISKGSGSGSTAVYNKEAANLSGIITIGAKISRTTGGGGDQFSMFALKENPSAAWANKGKKVATFAMASRNVFTHYLDGVGGTSTINAGTYDIPSSGIDWHRVWIVANLDNKTFDFYYDDPTAPVLINYPLANTSDSGTTLNTFLLYSDSNGAGHMNIDYFYACTGIQLDETKMPHAVYDGSGTGTISGNVISAGAAVEGASVTLIAADGETEVDTVLTDADGKFAFTNVTSKKGYSIKVSKTGYKDSIRDGINVNNDGTTEITLGLLSMDVPKPEPVLEDDFESYTAAKWTSNTANDTTSEYGAKWRVYNADETNQTIEIASETVDAGTNKYLHIKRTNKGTQIAAVFNQVETGLTGQVVIEARIKRTAQASNDQFSMYACNKGAFTYGSPKGSEVITSFYMVNDKLNTHTASSTAQVGSCTKDEWSDIRIVANTATKTFDFYLNDMAAPKLSNQPLKNGGKTIDRFLFFSTSNVNADICIDDFRVYTGEPYDDEW